MVRIFIYFESEFVFRGAYNGVQRRSRRLLRVMLGRFTSENRGQRKLATCSEIRICCMAVVCKWQRGRLRRRKKESPVPHPGSHSARGLLQALVSSRNRSSDWTRSGVSSSCGKLRGRPLTVKCLRRAAVNRDRRRVHALRFGGPRSTGRQLVLGCVVGRSVACTLR
jgi:hypothetical protein